jgi:Fe-S-cluster containining protein
VIAVSRRDLARFARHFGISEEQAERRFTKSAYGHMRVLRRKADPHFGRACRFLDPETRRCTVYAARPEVCRRFPYEQRCGYYDFLNFERRHQKDPNYVATTDNGLWR